MVNFTHGFTNTMFTQQPNNIIYTTRIHHTYREKQNKIGCYITSTPFCKQNFFELLIKLIKKVIFYFPNNISCL